MVGGSNDETNFLHKLLTKTQVSRICIAFPNGSIANIKFSKIQLSKMVKLRWFIPHLLLFALDLEKAMFDTAKKGHDLDKKELFDKIVDLVNSPNKILSELIGPETSLTNNEIKDIKKVIRSLENRGILLKETTEKIVKNFLIS